MKCRQWSAVMFWGGLWGISEATVSYLLHLFAPGYGWVFYYPLAYAFMAGVFRQTGKASSIIWASGLASAIKLINLFMTTRVDYVINPALSILLEGFVVFCAVSCVPLRQKPINRFFSIPLATSLAWRSLYLFCMLMMPDWIREASVLGKTGQIAGFLFMETLVNTALIALGTLAVELVKSLRRHSNQNQKKVLPEAVFAGISVAVLAISVFMQWAV